MNKILDVCGIPSCTKQIAQVKKTLRSMNAGDVLTVKFLDEIALIDFKILCQLTQHTLRNMIVYDEFYEIEILL